MYTKVYIVLAMRRGILILTSSEIIELTRHVDFEKFNLVSRDLKEENKILVNDEELEDILDEIGRPDGNEILKSAVKKISDVLLSLRNR
jgi:hypothetical protein